MSNTIENDLEILGTITEIRNLLSFLINTQSNIKDLVSMTGDVEFNLRHNNHDNIERVNISFLSENSPATLLVEKINNKFPSLKISGSFEFENERTTWKDELGLWRSYYILL